MTISDMCIKFRLYAQQAGMQNVRAILPEQIYQYLNSSITDTTNEIIRSAITIPDNSIVVDYGKVGRINALVPLQHTENADLDPSEQYTFNTITPYFIYKIEVAYTGGLTYPVDITEEKYIADKLSDYIFKPRFYKPLAVISITRENEVYIKFYFGGNHPAISKVYIKYIAKPNVVNASTECNLPEYLHEDIVKHAVELYLRALGMNPTTSNGSQEQVQQPQYNQQQNQQ